MNKKKSTHPLLIISVLLCSEISFADTSKFITTPEQNCSNVDFREYFDLKMRNQHELSWCFAHAAADYLQYAYQLTEQVSAADIAIQYSETNASKLISFFKKIFNHEYGKLPAQTGFIKIALDKITSQGYCPESALPSEEWLKIENNGVEKKVEISKAILEIQSLHQEVILNRIKKTTDLPFIYAFKNIDASIFFETLKSSSPKNLFQSIRKLACLNERKPFSNKPYKSNFQIKGKSFFSKINKSINEKMPVTIDFFSDVLRHSDSPKRSISELHTVLVYGRKFDPSSNQCHYLIKDSYGEQCTKYDPKLNCESGYVWLSERKLYKAATSSLILE